MTSKMMGQTLYYAALLVALYLFLRWFEWRSIYLPFRPVTDTPAQYGLPFEEVTLTAADGVKLHAWHLTHPRARQTLLFCHGNAGNISHRMEKLLIYNQLAVSVLIFDYRGYGRSEGRPNEHGTYRDGLAAYDWLRGQKKAPPASIVLYGESLGCAVATEIAVQREVGGMILESPFTSVPDMARALYGWLPLHLICQYRYDSLVKIARLKAPLLIMHSPADEIVPFAQAQRLFAAAPQPKTLVRLSGTHNDGFAVSEAVYRQALREFLAGLSG
jgi:hypothetical protein